MEEKIIKRIFASILSFVFLLTMGSVAFAAQDNSEGPTPVAPTYYDSFTYTKNYSIKWSGKNPAETLKFTISPGVVSNSTAPAPAFVSSEFEINVPAGEGITTSPKINFPVYPNVGIYNYTITETPNNTAGVTYNTTAMNLKVTVAEISADEFKPISYTIFETGKDKTTGILNEYFSSDLTIKKIVKGNFGDKLQYFPVVVTFKLPDEKIMGSTITYKGGKYATDQMLNGLTATVDIKHNDVITFSNIPEGVTYTVVETAPTGYTKFEDFSDENSKIDTETADTVTITNERNILPETGISLDSIPYILALGLAALGIAVMFFKRRQNLNI